MAEFGDLIVEDATRITGTVPYLNRLEVGLLMKKGGASAAPVRSYDELIKVCRALTPIVPVERFCPWVEENFGDMELVSSALAACEGVSLFGQREVILPLVEQRVAQAREVLSETNEDAE